MPITINPTKTAAAPRLAPVHKVAKAAAATVVSLGLSFAANAATVKLGGDDGSLAFVPSSVTITAGETIEFVNNAGFPHNVVFDEDAVPAGVDADALSYEDYLNSKGEVVSRKLTVPGTYGIYCDPHAGAGMKMTVTVK